MKHQTILKKNWERFKTHINLNKKQIDELIAPYSEVPVDNIQLLSEGCANTNYKITFTSDKPPVVLRIYTREKSAPLREKDLADQLKNRIPIPQILFFSTDTVIDYPYAIVEWREGVLMRDILLTGDESSIYECAFAAGLQLNLLHQIGFKDGGFFEKNLKVRPFSPEEYYYPFVSNCLQDPSVEKSLSHRHSSVLRWVERHIMDLPDEHEANLTHGDFDPANMLVKQVNGKWNISGLMDWEFAFAGTYLLDMGMFLRYAHRLPACYEQGFINGIQSSGFTLPASWPLQTKLMDMLCLLQLLQYNPAESRPNLNRDVVELIEHTVAHF